MDKVVANALNSISEGIVITDDKSNVIYWNHSMEQITGRKCDEVFLKNLFDVLPGLSQQYFIDLIQNLIENEGKLFFSAAMHNQMLNGNRKFNLKISKVRNDSNNAILYEFIDVSDQFLRINQLKSYINKLYQLNRELKNKEKEILQLAYYDRLTGLANRTLFYDYAGKMLLTAKETNGLLGFIFIDIDKFKEINDLYGHVTGDKVLVKVADILRKATNSCDFVSRYGGDEFLILFPDSKDLDTYKAITSRIINMKHNNIHFNHIKINISLSMGISFYPIDGSEIDQLIMKADKAMYAAKMKNGQDIYYCSDDIYEREIQELKDTR